LCAGSAREYERALEKLKEYRFRVRHSLSLRGLSKTYRHTHTDDGSDRSGDATADASPSSSTISALDKVLSDSERSPSPSEASSTLRAPGIESPYADGCSPWGTGEEHRRVRTSESISDNAWTARNSSADASSEDDSRAGSRRARKHFMDAVRRRYLSESARESSMQATDDDEDDEDAEDDEDEEGGESEAGTDEEDDEDEEQSDKDEDDEEEESGRDDEGADSPAHDDGGDVCRSTTPSTAAREAVRRNLKLP
jgi:hypothetical protein